MLAYALVVVVMLAGQHHEFVLDHGLTIEDCAQRIVENDALAASGALKCEKVYEIR